MNSQIIQLTVKNHLNKVTDDEVVMFTSESRLDTMTSEACTECISSSITIERDAEMSCFSPLNTGTLFL